MRPHHPKGRPAPGLIPVLVRHRKPVFIATITLFLLGIFVGLGGYLITDLDVANAVAEVGKEKIPRLQFQIQVRSVLEQMREQKREVTDAVEHQVQSEVLRDLIVERLFAHEAERLGLVVTDDELAADIRATFQRDGVFDQGLYFYTVQSQMRSTPEDFEDRRRRALLAAKYRELISRSVKVTPDEVRDIYARQNGGMKKFDENRALFTARLQQQRAVEMLNYRLRQLSQTTEIKSYLQ